MRVKRLDRVELHAGRQRRRRRVDVLLHAERRELRRHRDADDARDAAAGELGERVLDERRQLRMPTATGTSGAEPRAQRLRLRERDVGQRRASADRLVVVPHLVRRARRTAAVRRGRASGTPASRRARTACRAPSGERRRESWSMSHGSNVRIRGSDSTRATNSATLERRPSNSYSCSRLLMHVPRERLHVLDRRRRQDAVAEIEDVARAVRPRASSTSSVAAKMRSSGPSSSVGSRLPWMRAIEADALPRLVERRAPVGADDVAAGLAQLAEDRAGADAEMDRRHAASARRARRCGACAAG